MKKIIHSSLALVCILFLAGALTVHASGDKHKKNNQVPAINNQKPKDASGVIGMPDGSSTPGELVNAPISFNDNKTIPLDPTVRTGTLPNGLKYFIKHNSKPEDRVELRLVVNAGSNQEDDDQRGLAHFVEHMAFNGSKHFAKNDLINFLESAGVKFGAHLNAYTSFDETVYRLQLPTDQKDVLAKGLLVLQDWAGGLSFDTTEINKERGVVFSEWRNGLGPNQRMLDKWLPVYYYQSRYAQRLPIGDTGIIKRGSYERLTSFYHDWYRPDLMAVIIVGDINADSMEKAVKATFTSLKNPPNERKKELYPLPPHQKTLASICTDPEAVASTVMIGYIHPKEDLSTYSGYKTYTSNALINSMMSRRLAEITQLPDPPFIQASGSYGQETRLNDAYTSIAYVKSGKSQDALKTLLIENERVRKYGFTQTELDLAKKAYLKGMEDALKEKDKTQSGSLVNEYLSYFLHDVPAPGIEKEYQMANQVVPAITLDQVNELAKDYIANQNRVVVITAPDLEKNILPWENDVVEYVDKVPTLDIQPYVDKVATEPLFSETPKGSPVVKETRNDSFNITHLELANGVHIIVKPTDFKNDEILFTAFSPGGTSLYVDDDFMSADYSNYIITEAGIANFDKTMLQKMLVGKTVDVSPYVDELKEGFNGSCAPADLETLLQLVNLYFTHPRRSESDYASLINKEHGQYDHILDNPQYYFANKLQSVIYNNSIRRGLPTKEKLNMINYDKAFKIYSERFNNAADFTFVFVGNIDTLKLKSLAEEYLGSLPTTPARETWKDPNVNKPTGHVQTTVQMGNTPKTLVAIHYHGKAPWSEQEEYNFNSMLKVLNITLRESLREDKGGVYGVSVAGSFIRRPQERYGITIYFNCDPPRKEELIQLVYDKIKALCDSGTTQDKVGKVQEMQRRDRETNLRENGYWLDQIEYYATFGEDISHLNDYPKMIDALSLQTIQAAAKKYLSGDNRIEVVLEPKKESSNQQ